MNCCSFRKPIPTINTLSTVSFIPTTFIRGTINNNALDGGEDGEGLLRLGEGDEEVEDEPKEITQLSHGIEEA